MKKNHSVKNSFFPWCFSAGLICFIMIACNSGCPENEETKIPPQEEAKTSILEKIKTANEKWAAGNPLGFVECAAEDIVWMDDLAAQLPVSGKENLQAYLENFVGQIPPHQHELSDMAFRFYDDVVIITYRYTASINGETADPWKVTSVYKYMDGGWWSIHENWSLVMKKQ